MLQKSAKHERERWNVRHIPPDRCEDVEPCSCEVVEKACCGVIQLANSMQRVEFIAAPNEDDGGQRG